MPLSRGSSCAGPRRGSLQHLGVAIGVELVAQRLQFRAQQCPVVVDGAAEHQAQAQLVIDHRLAGGRRQVHDLQRGRRWPKASGPLLWKPQASGPRGARVVGDFLEGGQVGPAVGRSVVLQRRFRT